jgi:ubiquinone/menaquinone biosynthesis C-methylase UbiE
MNLANVKERYQDEWVVKCYDRKRFTGPIGRTIDALEKRAIRRAVDVARAEFPRHQPTVLDLPCGTGRITELLLDQGLQVTAGDISQPMLEAAEAKLARFGDRVDFRQLDLEGIDLPDSSFDLISCIRLFNHVGPSERGRMLRELARVSRRFVIANMSFTSLPYRWVPYLKAGLGMPLPKVLPTWPELHREMAGIGLRIKDFFYELRFLSEVVVVLLEKTDRQ